MLRRGDSGPNAPRCDRQEGVGLPRGYVHPHEAANEFPILTRPDAAGAFLAGRLDRVQQLVRVPDHEEGFPPSMVSTAPFSLVLVIAGSCRIALPALVFRTGRRASWGLEADGSRVIRNAALGMRIPRLRWRTSSISRRRSSSSSSRYPRRAVTAGSGGAATSARGDSACRLRLLRGTARASVMTDRLCVPYGVWSPEHR
jgi:hypothetical protein